MFNKRLRTSSIMRLFSAEEMPKLQLQQQKHQLRQLPQEWNLNYQLIQMNQLTVSATKLVTGRWLPVIILMYVTILSSHYFQIFLVVWVYKLTQYSLSYQCKIEWFHFGCVGLKEQPKGKWYCSDCAGSKGRRKGRWYRYQSGVCCLNLYERH